MDEQKNVILATILTFALLTVWYYWFELPREQAENHLRMQRQAQQAQQLANPVPAASPAAQAVSVRPLETILSDPARKSIAVDTPSLKGSISLAGARIDNLELRRIKETLKPDSHDVRIFAPLGTAAPYYAQYGWKTSASDVGPLPDGNTVWQSPDTKLTQDAPVTLTWDNGKGLIFHQKIEVDSNYLFTVTQSVENKTEPRMPVPLRPYAKIVRQNKPKVEKIYQFEGLVGYIGTQNKQELTYEKAQETAEKREAPKTFSGETGGWLGFTDRYWSAVLVPDQKLKYDAVMGHFVQNGHSSYETVYTIAGSGDEQTAVSHLFAGVKKSELIHAYQQQYTIEGFDYVIDWGWLSFTHLPQAMLNLLQWINGYTGNFGIAILLITVLIKAIFFPLNYRSFAAMSQMKLLQPAMAQIKERYPDDSARQQQEIMAMYRREKINPLAGCIPMFLQIPVFLALYNVLNVAFEMRHAPFFGWIHDLSAPDPTWIFNLFGLLPFGAPDFVANGFLSFMMIGVWPLLMGITMFLQMRLSPMPPDPTQQMVFNWMPVVFTAMLASAPAGLVIYWTWNNLLSMIQQAVIMSRYGTKIELFDNLGISKLIGRAAPAQRPAPVAPVKQVSPARPQNDNKPKPRPKIKPKHKARRKGA
jgi:YidC/Oxa1 family membrane protein insertase